MNKKIGIGVLLLLLLLALGFVYSDSDQTEEIEKTEEITVREGSLLIDMMADGNVEIPKFIQYFETSGIIEKINFEVGNTVSANDVIATLKSDDLRLEIQQKKLTLDAEKIKASDNTKNNSYDIDLQMQKIKEAKKNVEDLNEDINIMSLSPEMYPLQDLKESKKNLEIANSELDNLINYVELIRTNDVDSNDISVKQAEIELSIANNEFDKTSLVSMYDGVVIGIQLEVGTKVDENDEFAIIASDSAPIITSYVSELDIFNIEVGQKVYVEFESDLGMQFDSKVKFINPIPRIDTNGIVSYEVVVEMLEYPDSTLDGMTALIRFVLKERINVLIIPNNAVRIVNGDQIVDVKKGDIIESFKIMTGLTDGLNVEVISGLEKKDILIVSSKK